MSQTLSRAIRCLTFPLRALGDRCAAGSGNYAKPNLRLAEWMRAKDKMKTETTIENLLAHIASECRAVDTDELYDSMLDECYSFESVGGIFASISPSRVLRECDPIAYRCGKNDWLDSERDTLIEIGSDYYEKHDVEEAKTSFVADLEAEVSELEREIEELDGEEFHEEEENNDARILELNARLDTLRSNVIAAETHSF